MASRAERRAALEAARTNTNAPTSALAPAEAPEEHEEGMKIQYDSVRLEFEIPRFSSVGQASASSSEVKAVGGVSITYDTAAGVVRITGGAVTRSIPVGRVLWFGNEVPQTP